MTLDTDVPGDAEQVEVLARWLRETLGHAVGLGGDALVASRRTVESDWDGRTGAALEATFGTAAPRADDLADDVRHAARAVADFADALSRAQAAMAGVRSRATLAGLVVDGARIVRPAAAELVAVYDVLCAEVASVRRTLAAAEEALADEYAARASTMLTLRDIAGGLADGGTLLVAARLRGYATSMQNHAVANLVRLRVPPGRGGMAKFREDLGRNARAHRAAEPHRLRADAWEKGASPSVGKALKGGAPLALLGIGLDIAGGKEPVQATVSGGTGFLASVGAGAVAGGAVGSVVPVAGTAVGAVVGALVGAGVGIFTSGATDSVFESGPDVGAAWQGGIDAIEDFGGGLYDLFAGQP